jgi:hypothetical protein
MTAVVPDDQHRDGQERGKTVRWFEKGGKVSRDVNLTLRSPESSGGRGWATSSLL